MADIFTNEFWAQYGPLLLTETWKTLIMLGVSTLFAYVIGLPLGVLLVLTNDHGIRPHKTFNSVLGWIINVGRSLPFMILMVSIVDFTKFIVGTFVGVRGAIVPLVVSAAPFIARMVESSLAEVDGGVVEAAQSMGASPFQIVRKVYLPEAIPSLVLGASISIITILAYVAIAGAVGAGGLGDLALRYGYQRKVKSVNLVTIILLIVLVQIVQSVFSRLSTSIDKRLSHEKGKKKLNLFSHSSKQEV
ncbi:MAG: ABC transporter permease [Oscillospiraceae bacterium]|nr:ABC transporter permease [Oscillospiraceae bacterium]